MNPAVFDIYYDSLTEASWFASLHPAFNLRNNRFHIIERRGSNPPLPTKNEFLCKNQCIKTHFSCINDRFMH